MINTEEIFKEFIEFNRNRIIEERQYINDDGKDSERFITSSLNGLHTKEALRIHIDCLIQRGFNRFKQKNAKRILKDDGIGKLKSIMLSMSGELLGFSKSIKPKMISFPPVSFLELKQELNFQDYEDWKNAIISGISTLEITNAYNTIIADAIENFPKRANELILEFGKELKKIEFKVDSEFMRKHGKDLYDELINSKEMEANIDDFFSLCRGEMPIEKVKFKQDSSLGTFINILKKNTLLKTGRCYWAFLANDACKSFDGDFDSDQLRKNRGANHNEVVKNSIIKFLT